MIARRAPLALLCLVLAAPASCKDSAKKADDTKAQKVEDDDTSGGKKKPKGDDDDDAKKKNSKKKSKGDDGDDDAKKKPKSDDGAGFDAAMKKARDAVAKKDYKGAIAAYDDACDAREDDALAFGERGYAKVLDTQYDAGIKDLDAALAKTDDAKLLGPIWYNLGLAREGKGEKPGAIEAYKKSNELRPTKAAQNKLAALGDAAAAPTGCPAKVDTKRVEAKKYAGWLDLYKALAKKDGVDAPDVPPKSDDAALKVLCSAGCTGKGPFLVQLGGVDSGGGAQVIALAGVGADGKVFAWDDVGGGMNFMRCGYADDAKLLPGAALLRVHVRSEPLELAAFDDKGKACTPGNEGCMTGCTSEHWTESDQFYDLEALVRVASVVEAGKQGPGGKHTQVVACASDATGKIGITGGGCNQLIKTGAGDANPNACAAPADKDAFKCVQGKTCPKGWHGDAGLTCRRICAKSADCKELGHVCSNAFGGDDLLCDVKEVKPTR